MFPITLPSLSQNATAGRPAADGELLGMVEQADLRCRVYRAAPAGGDEDARQFIRVEGAGKRPAFFDIHPAMPLHLVLSMLGGREAVAA